MAAKQRWASMRLGGRENGLPMTERIARWSVPEPNAGCWLWLGCMTSVGYGQLMVRDPSPRMAAAHRLSYVAYVAPIPTGLVIDHKCCNPACVNPDHLRAVTKAFNTLIGKSPAARNARTTHCKHGHAFTPDNTQAWRGTRRCRTCLRSRRVLKENPT